MQRFGTMRAARPATRYPPQRSGLTLFEVVLSLAIFLMSLAAVSQLISVGSRASVDAQLETEAALFAESKMAEVISGAVPLDPVSGQPVSSADAAWQWSLTENTAPLEGLKDITVTVTHLGPDGEPDVTFSLRRYLRDPQLFIDAALERQSEETEESADESSAGSASSAGGSN